MLAHELFARGPTDFEIRPPDWPGLAVYIKSANGGRATGRAPRSPCSPRRAARRTNNTQYCRPTDIHVHLPGIYICTFFFFIFYHRTSPLRDSSSHAVWSLTAVVLVFFFRARPRRVHYALSYTAPGRRIRRPFRGDVFPSHPGHHPRQGAPSKTPGIDHDTGPPSALHRYVHGRRAHGGRFRSGKIQAVTLLPLSRQWPPLGARDATEVCALRRVSFPHRSRDGDAPVFGLLVAARYGYGHDSGPYHRAVIYRLRRFAPVGARMPRSNLGARHA